METESELLEMLRDYRSGGTVTEQQAAVALRKLAELQKIAESFVIASSVDIPEIDPTNALEPNQPPKTNRTKQIERKDVTGRLHSADLGIVVPLREEFAVLHSYIARVCRIEKDEQTSSHYYQFDWPQNSDAPYKCVATFAGEMGNSKAGFVTQRLLQNWSLMSVAVIGIAAGISDDVKVGDVVAATLVDSYMENSKATGGNPSEIKLSGEPYRPSSQILNEIRNFEFAHRSQFGNWKKECRTLAGMLLGDHKSELVQSEIIRSDPTLVEGHIASGPTVGATKDFVEWLKNQRDRKYVALEMEGAGVLSAIYDSASDCQTLMLRGISDYADRSKSQLDRLLGGSLRTYAVHAAIQFFWQLLAAGALAKQSSVSPLVSNP